MVSHRLLSTFREPLYKAVRPAVDARRQAIRLVPVRAEKTLKFEKIGLCSGLRKKKPSQNEVENLGSNSQLLFVFLLGYWSA